MADYETRMNPLVVTALLITIAVAASVLTYQWVMSNTQFTTYSKYPQKTYVYGNVTKLWYIDEEYYASVNRVTYHIDRDSYGRVNVGDYVELQIIDKLNNYTKYQLILSSYTKVKLKEGDVLR